MAEVGGRTNHCILELKGIYKDFDGLEVLFGINLGIQDGERHAIIGPNGAGKSTIFNLITGKYLPSKGNILFKGQDITGILTFQAQSPGNGPILPDNQHLPDHDGLPERAECHPLQE